MTVAVPQIPLARPSTTCVPPSEATPSFTLGTTHKSYRHQYSNIYFIRLRQLRKFVEERARKKWKNIEGGATFVPRVLEVEKGKLCFVIGTVYMDMPLKPNVLEDIARDHSIPAPPPKPKFCSEDDNIMLEDESGRICLVGDKLKSAGLVTGVILGALGAETKEGDFEVVDYCFAEMAHQPHHETESVPIDVSPSDSDEWVALVSGLEVGALSASDAQIQLLVEFLTGESGEEHDQLLSSRISRLIIAGNSFAEVVAATSGIEEEDRRTRRQAQETTTFTPHPTLHLAAYLSDIARSIPIHLLPGASDPSGTILPQRCLPRAMFGEAANYSSFSCETNPAFIHITTNPSTPSHHAKSKEASTSKASSTTGPTLSRTFLVNSGQPVDDMYKYLPTPPHTRLSMAESTLRWRHMAPTAPDTLWCHPYFSEDPFIITETPDFYIIGNQPKFKTKLVTDKARQRSSGGTSGSDEVESEKRCRVILVPNFRETGMIVLANLRTLGVKTLSFVVEGMSVG